MPQIHVAAPCTFPVATGSSQLLGGGCPEAARSCTSTCSSSGSGPRPRRRSWARLATSRGGWRLGDSSRPGVLLWPSVPWPSSPFFRAAFGAQGPRIATRPTCCCALSSRCVVCPDALGAISDAIVLPLPYAQRIPCVQQPPPPPGWRIPFWRFGQSAGPISPKSGPKCRFFLAYFEHISICQNCP